MKIHSRKLRNAKWDLTLPLADARRDDELVSIGDSQMLRWIDELNGITDAEKTARSLKKEIKRLKKSEHSFQNKKEIKRLYSELDKVQFKPDYMCLIIDRVSDYRRACKGFKINGIKYVRLLGTNGGVKASTIVFVSERLAPELKRRIENGRDPEKKFIPAKFEAYRALTCSGSTPVSMPYGIAVVNDCETSFVEDVISMRDGDGDEPIMEYTYGAEITLDESDGYGIMLPSLAERWSKELGLSYTAAGMNTRFSWEKGMVFTFDYLDFADNVAGTRMIKDAWGNDVDLGQTELILTTSMLKLWNAYPDLETYLKCCKENHYTFGVPKVCPEELENERGLNYQFIQCYDLDDDDIEKLTAHTREVFRDVLTGDYARAVLFLKGVGLNEHNVDYIDDDFVKAMMIDKRVFDDPFVKRTIYHMIRKRINDAKVGVLMVHGNYSIVCGDPYALCQSMFGLPVTGLLKKGEIYNRYWIDDGADEVMCFRAPMTSINNVRKAKVARGEQPEYWYRYMNTCTLFNCWDTMAAALNGMDKDGDLVFTTDNEVLLNKFVYKPTVMCEQHNAEKMAITEENLIESNINSFGDDIGRITNHITAMFEVQSGFPKGSPEYETLEYRITCGEHLQQNSIDKSKGIISKPMPRFWYDMSGWTADDTQFDGEAAREINREIVADKKPYFMIYVYPDLMRQYKDYVKHTATKAMCCVGTDIKELMARPEESFTEQEKDFVDYCRRRTPVGTGNCVMNGICRLFEKEFDGCISRYCADVEFDYTFMKSGRPYTQSQYTKIAKEYRAYLSRQREMASDQNVTILSTSDISASDRYYQLNDEFMRNCFAICANEETLCDILLDVCYKSDSSKQFVWSVCGEQIVDNLISGNGVIHYPEKDSNGDITYSGMTFTMNEKEATYYVGNYFE